VSAKFLVTELDGLEPLTVTVQQVEWLTGESRSQIYKRIGRNEYDAVKSGQRLLIVYESVKRRIAALPRAKIKPPASRKHPRAGKDASNQK
jgi:predicted DNA-binding transcriptional regulator AlpA